MVGEVRVGDRVTREQAARAFSALTLGMEPDKRYLVFLDSFAVDAGALASWCDQEPKESDPEVQFILLAGKPSECVVMAGDGQRVFIDASAVGTEVEGVVRVECGGKGLREALWAEGGVFGLSRAVPPAVGGDQ